MPHGSLEARRDGEHEPGGSAERQVLESSASIGVSLVERLAARPYLDRHHGSGAPQVDEVDVTSYRCGEIFLELESHEVRNACEREDRDVSVARSR